MRLACFLTTTLLLATPALAAPLSFDQAMSRALQETPGLKARGLQVDAARSQSIAAGQLPDPKLTLGFDNFPISGPPAGRFDRDNGTMQTFGFSQDVPSNAKRRALRERAGTDISLAEAEVRVTAREVRIATALAWIDLYYAKRRLAAIDYMLKTLGPLWQSADAGVASGTSRPAQAIEPAQVKGAFEDQRAELLAAVGKARAELARWTDDPEADVAGDPPEFTVDAAALRAGIDRHPSLLAYDASADQAEADVRLARAQKQPDWSFGVTYGHRDPVFGETVSATATVSLPLFGDHRQDPMIAARIADASRVRMEREDTRRSLRAALDADLADHVMHHDQWMRARDTLLPLAKQRSDLETASYGADRANLPDVLAAFTALAQAQLNTLDREAMVARDGARITLTYGAEDL
jgi:cobalt-zinc-cadmium efflux system outer membrane protein